ncbi:Facilitated trehalose transporter Tret1-2 [Amphibalanus amphitrite]|uniref:Facilitated trehalose transporter Tret1-2 n=1 Tax=Amphibalanus amphitrite TaxID=1232801 RepID=A0A6A4VV45_AMPAM|nr:Facilitated trehalose transporter Tret1-2 [Amphibalanus amphitrite]
MSGTATAAGQLCRRLAATTAAGLLASSYGLAIGWATVANWQLQLPHETLRLAATQRSWLISMMYVGVAVGSPVGGWLGGRLGSKGALFASAPATLASGVVIFFASSYEMLMAGRLLIGLGSGMSNAVYMMYISGTSRPAERGLFSMLSEVGIVGGTVLAVAAGELVDWRWLAVLCAVLATAPPAALLVLLPSDPVWLLARHRDAEAQRAADLLGLRLSEMAAGAAPQHDAPWREMLHQLGKRRNVAPLALVLALFFFRAFSGYYTILAYSLEFFRDVGLALDPSLTALLFGGVTVAATAVTSVLIDRLGRRPLLLASAASTALCYLGLVLVYQVPALAALPALPVLLLLAAGFLFYVGLGCVPHCLVGELFPEPVRFLGGSLVPVAYCVFSIVALLLFPPTVAALGPSGMFLCHVACMVVAFVLVMVALPETRGLPLTAIETLFDPCAKPQQDKQKHIKQVESGSH